MIAFSGKIDVVPGAYHHIFCRGDESNRRLFGILVRYIYRDWNVVRSSSKYYRQRPKYMNEKLGFTILVSYGVLSDGMRVVVMLSHTVDASSW
jgi:hypothetical protein